MKKTVLSDFDKYIKALIGPPRGPFLGNKALSGKLRELSAEVNS